MTNWNLAEPGAILHIVRHVRLFDYMSVQDFIIRGLPMEQFLYMLFAERRPNGSCQ